MSLNSVSPLGQAAAATSAATATAASTPPSAASSAANTTISIIAANTLSISAASQIVADHDDIMSRLNDLIPNMTHENGTKAHTLSNDVHEVANSALEESTSKLNDEQMKKFHVAYDAIVDQLRDKLQPYELEKLRAEAKKLAAEYPEKIDAVYLEKHLSEVIKGLEKGFKVIPVEGYRTPDSSPRNKASSAAQPKIDVEEQEYVRIVSLQDKRTPEHVWTEENDTLDTMRKRLIAQEVATWNESCAALRDSVQKVQKAGGLFDKSLIPSKFKIFLVLCDELKKVETQLFRNLQRNRPYSNIFFQEYFKIAADNLNTFNSLRTPERISLLASLKKAKTNKDLSSSLKKYIAMLKGELIYAIATRDVKLANELRGIFINIKTNLSNLHNALQKDLIKDFAQSVQDKTIKKTPNDVATIIAELLDVPQRYAEEDLKLQNENGAQPPMLNEISELIGGYLFAGSTELYPKEIDELEQFVKISNNKTGEKYSKRFASMMGVRYQELQACENSEQVVDLIKETYVENWVRIINKTSDCGSSLQKTLTLRSYEGPNTLFKASLKPYIDKSGIVSARSISLLSQPRFKLVDRIADIEGWCAGANSDLRTRMLFSEKSPIKGKLECRSIWSIPNDWYLDTYKYINLAHNALTRFPFRDIQRINSEYSGITSMDLSHNLLTQFPLEVYHIKHLRYLDLRGNYISDWPYEVNGMKAVEKGLYRK